MIWLLKKQRLFLKNNRSYISIKYIIDYNQFLVLNLQFLKKGIFHYLLTLLYHFLNKSFPLINDIYYLILFILYTIDVSICIPHI